LLPTMHGFDTPLAFSPSPTNVGEFSFTIPGAEPIPGATLSGTIVAGLPQGSALSDDYFVNDGPASAGSCDASGTPCSAGSADVPAVSLSYTLSPAALAALVPAIATGSIDLSLTAAAEKKDDTANVDDAASVEPDNLYFVPMVLAGIGIAGMVIAGIARAVLVPNGETISTAPLKRTRPVKR